MKKVFDKIAAFFIIIWIIPLIRYFAIAILIGIIIGLVRGNSPLYNIF